MARKPALPPNLQFCSQLGKGAYGEVFLCDDETRGEKVAVKWIKDFARDPLFGKRILREVRVLTELQHDNLLKLTDVFTGNDCNDVYIVMPYMQLDLHKVIYAKMKVELSDKHAQAFAFQILHGLKYLHTAGVVHRDLKPSNILVNKDCTLRIADFGLANGRRGRNNSEEEQLTDYVVTRWYRAPELMLLPSGYFEAVDLWSVGCIHAELVRRKPLFPGDNHVDMLRRIAGTISFDAERDLQWLPEDGVEREKVLNFVETVGLHEIPHNPKERALKERLDGCSEACVEFVRELLAFDPNMRLSAANAMQHRYLVHLTTVVPAQKDPEPFNWEFDVFDPTPANLKERIRAEVMQLHPELAPAPPPEAVPVAEKLSEKRTDGSAAAQKPLGPPPARLPRRPGVPMKVEA